MNELVVLPAAVVAAILIAAAMSNWLRTRVRRQRQRLRDEGYRLIHELKAYSAWIESLRWEALLPAEPEELIAADALRNARAITHASFPVLGHSMLALLEADSQLMGLLWQHKILCMGDTGASRPAQGDPEYRQLRDGQEDLIEEIIARCQVLIGDRDRVWRNTDMDSEFAASLGGGASTSPCR
jgi:hypothetical protein